MTKIDPSRVCISARLLPAVKIGTDAWLSVEPMNQAGDDGKPCWRWFIDSPDLRAEGDDLRGWGTAGEMLETMLSFMLAAADAMRYQRSGWTSDNAELFSPEVMEWCDNNSEEIQSAWLCLQSEEEDAEED